MSDLMKGILKNNGMQPSASATPNPKPAAKKEGEGGEQNGGDQSDGHEDGEDTAAKALADAEALRIANEAKKKAGGEGGAGTGGEGNNNGTGTEDEDDIDDARIIKALEKRGRKVASLDEITKPADKELTPEEKEVAEQQRRDSIRQFALQSKKVTSTQFDNYVKETNIPKVELAFELFRKERLEELKAEKVPADQLPDIKALRDEFDDAHFQFAAQDDPKRVRQEKILDRLVDDYIADKYSNILDLDEEYSAHETEKVQRHSYSGVIDTVLSDLGPEMELEITNGKEKFPFKFKITPEVTKIIRQSYLNDTSFKLFGQSNVNKELIASAVRGNILQHEFAKILSEGAVAYASKKVEEAAKGRRGIKPERENTGGEGGEKQVNKTVQGILNQPENKSVLQKN